MGTRGSPPGRRAGERNVKLDRQRAVAELDIPTEFYDELLHDFLDGARTALEDLEEAVREGRPDEIHAIAHMLKGSAASMRLEEMRAIARGLEAATREDESMEDLQKHVTELRTAVAELSTLLS